MWCGSAERRRRGRAASRAWAAALAVLAAQLGPGGGTAAAQSPSLEILALPGSVRSAGLNGSGAALAGDAGSVFANPAGLALVRHLALEGTYRRWQPGGLAASAAMGWRLAQFDLGGGVAYSRPDSLAAGGGPARRPAEAMAVGSVVYRFGLLALGGSIREVRRTSTTPGAAVERARSGDLGAMIAFFDILAIGVAVQNLGGNWLRRSALALPRLTRWGFTMHYTDPQESFRLMSTVEGQWPEGGPSRWIVGGEAGAVIHGVGVLGRAAYRTRSRLTGDPAVSLGASFAVGNAQVDYAYGSRDRWASPAHRLGLRLRL